MKQVLVLAVMLVVAVMIVSVAFGAEKENAKPAPQAFGFTFGILTPRGAIDLIGGDQPAAASLGSKKPAEAFGFTFGILTPRGAIDLIGGDQPAENCLVPPEPKK